MAVIALCAVATVATAGTCGLAFAMASGALKGALIGAATGAVGGGLKSAMDYMEEHDTLDGSGSQILSGAADGFAKGAASGAASGAMAGMVKYHKNPSGYCFVAGTLVLTTIGLVAIENIQPGDMVYAKEAVGVEQSVDVSQDSETAPVLEVFAHEVDETYVVTIDGEDIETTANHPFYDENGEQVEAKDLEEGDELTTEDGDTATVDSVECIHHDEPVMVYNFCVMEDHTYFVGEHGVLVHNGCGNKTAEAIKDKTDSIKKKLGGAYKDVPADGGQVHHMPADSVSPLSKANGPGIRMETVDHMKTASWGSSKAAKEYRRIQKGLIDSGKFLEAQQMDIDNVRSLFGNKYDDAIAEMLDYTKTITIN